MLRNKPRLTYCGLTVVLSNPSRFDSVNLLSATGGQCFYSHCLKPDYNAMQCDIRLADDESPFLPNTKCILLCGEYAMHKWLPLSQKNTLNELRGSVYEIQGIPAIPTFFPQDAADIVGHEQALNPLSKEFIEGEDSHESEESEDYEATKTHGRTKRANYAFWLRADVKKAKQLLQTSWSSLRSTYKSPEYIQVPSSSEVIRILTGTKNSFLYFDVETDYEDQNLQCFSFSFDGRTIYNVPVLDHNYQPAYSALPHIIRALTVAIYNNTVVAHNGANFDFFVLGTKYRIPVYRVYDTMIAMHRCFPDVEKSLGHCTSYWTWENFHKDEDSKGYMTKDQMMARLKYCGKDVYTMFLIHQAITTYAKTIPGLTHSIDTANSHIVPYLTTTIQGICYSQKKVDDLKNENDRLMMQYLRIIDILIGKTSMDNVRKVIKGKAKGFPGSNTQCVEYFHNMLGYPVVARSQKTRNPSLGKKAMFKLALMQDNPVIKFVLMYRTVQKEYGTLKFMPWRGDDGKIIDWRTWGQPPLQQPQLPVLYKQ